MTYRTRSPEAGACLAALANERRARGKLLHLTCSRARPPVLGSKCSCRPCINWTSLVAVTFQIYELIVYLVIVTLPNWINSAPPDALRLEALRRRSNMCRAADSRASASLVPSIGRVPSWCFRKFVSRLTLAPNVFLLHLVGWCASSSQIQDRFQPRRLFSYRSWRPSFQPPPGAGILPVLVGSIEICCVLHSNQLDWWNLTALLGQNSCGVQTWVLSCPVMSESNLVSPRPNSCVHMSRARSSSSPWASSSASVYRQRRLPPLQNISVSLTVPTRSGLRWRGNLPPRHRIAVSNAPVLMQNSPFCLAQHSSISTPCPSELLFQLQWQNPLWTSLMPWLHCLLLHCRTSRWSNTSEWNP